MQTIQGPKVSGPGRSDGSDMSGVSGGTVGRSVETVGSRGVYIYIYTRITLYIYILYLFLTFFYNFGSSICVYVLIVCD